MAGDGTHCRPTGLDRMQVFAAAAFQHRDDLCEPPWEQPAMMSSAPALIHRVSGLIREHQSWFEAVESWYKTAKWSKKIFTNYLMARNRPAGRALLSVNDRTLEDPFR